MNTDASGTKDTAPADAQTTAPDADSPTPEDAPPAEAVGDPAESDTGEIRRRTLQGDELAALEEQRDFLLRSLADLDREHEAGDVDEHDYVALRDDYTKRAARVIRQIEAQAVRSRRPASRQARWRKVGVYAGVALFAVLAGVLVAQTSGRRDPGETITGGVSESNREKLDEAVRLASQGEYDEAIALQDEILEDDPDNVEAMAYKGWFQVLSGDAGEGMVSLTEAVDIDPEYPDTHAFLAVVLARAGRPDYALQELDRLNALNPPPEIAQMVEGLRTDLEASTTTTAAPPP
jgi:tetratricopeptide (TPR) repeat protein